MMKHLKNETEKYKNESKVLQKKTENAIFKIKIGVNVSKKAQNRNQVNMMQMLYPDTNVTL